MMTFWWFAMVGISGWVILNAAIGIVAYRRYWRMDAEDRLVYDFRDQLDHWDSAVFLSGTEDREDA